MNIEIANRLVQLRKQNNFSQEALAARLGISRQAVSKWERAEASPDTDNLILLARLYGVSLDELLQTEDEIPRPEPEDEAIEGTIETEEAEKEDDSQNVCEEKQTKLVRVLYAIPYPVFVTVIYLVMGFWRNLWHPGWIIYLTIPIYYWLVGVIQVIFEAKE